MTANTSFRISSLKNLGIFPSWRMLNPANEICWNNLNIHNKVINHTIAIEWCLQGTRWSTHKFVKYHKRFKIKKLVVTSAGWHWLGTILYNMWRFYTKEISTITTIYWFISTIYWFIFNKRNTFCRAQNNGRSMNGQNFKMTGQICSTPVTLTGHICCFDDE